MRQALYYIYKEALHNVVKHAQAQQIRVRLLGSGLLELEVRDDSQGLVGPPGPGGQGLRNMRMRAAAVGGCVSLTATAAATGVHLTARLSLRRQAVVIPGLPGLVSLRTKAIACCKTLWMVYALLVKPTLVLFDIGLPLVSGIEGLAMWQQYPPEAAVAIFSIHTDADRVFKVLRAGAVGYLDKMTPLPMLAELLRQVAAGGSPMSPSVARHVIRHPWPARRPIPPARSARKKLCAALKMT